MSWSFSATGANREEALKHLRTAASADTHIPQGLVDDVIGAAVSLSWQVAPDRAVSFSSSGHVDPEPSGYSYMSVSFNVSALPRPTSP